MFKIVWLVCLSIIIAGCNGEKENGITASGTIEVTQVSLSAKISGEITALRVDEGSPVKQGDTLAEINHEMADIELRQAIANAAAAEAQYRLIVKGSRQEDLLQADANYQNAKSDFLRIEDLFRGKSATQKQYDDAKTRLVVAEQTYEKLKRGARSEEIQTALARHEQAQAAVEAIRKKIRDATVISPCEGIVTQKVVEQGENAIQGGTMFRIAQLSKVNLMIYVTEVELASVKIGQNADISIDAYPDRKFSGKVIYISPNAEFTPKNVQTKDDRTKLVFGVKIEIPNDDMTLKPGMPADATLASK